MDRADAETISLMGDKINSKNFVQKRIYLHFKKHPKCRMQKNWLPYSCKASAGGGGKGMRIVKTEKELKDAVVAAKEANLVLTMIGFF